jgi:hypothetical protein
MKNIIYLFAVMILACCASCTSCNSELEIPVTNLNKTYTLILDLSDRLMAPNQCVKDIDVIKKVFAQFEAQAKSKLTIGAKDAFSVLIIPQKGSAIDVNSTEINLQIDLSKINAGDKVNMLASFKKNLDTILHKLYNQAYKGSDANSYYGVDIWEYLNDYSATICNDERQNNVIILTDGYFDFINNTHVLYKDNRFTSTQFLSKLAGANWHQQAMKNNYGLIPIALGASCNYIIAGIHSKNQNDILEMKKLQFFWNQWLQESGAKNYHIVLDANSMTLSSQISNSLK